MRGMDALLERTFDAEQRHFWFRGFKRFVAPLLAEATAGPISPASRCRLRHGRKSHFPSGYGTPFGLELCRGGSGSDTSAACPADAGQRHAPAVRDASVDVVVSFDVLYCLETLSEHGHRRDVPGAAARRRRRDQRGRADMLRGDHSVMGGEVRRYTKRELRKSLNAPAFGSRV